MKLEKYIKTVLENIKDPLVFEVEFDIGVEPDMTVNSESPNRVKFTVTRPRFPKMITQM